MSSLKSRIELLETDLKAVPPRISVYRDLPFAILRYNPDEEWELRREIHWLSTRLENAGKDVHVTQISKFLWKAIDETEGMEAVEDLERELGYPGSLEGSTELRFMDLRDRDALGNYRVKIYG
jgi:hypothetical protein